MSIISDISLDVGVKRKSAGKYHATRNLMAVVFAASLFLGIVSRVSAQPGKAAEASTKQSTVPDPKPEAANPSSPVAKTAPDPAICVKPNDGGTAQSSAAEDKSSTSSSSSSSTQPARMTAGAGEGTAETESEPNTEFMKDKLKLSIGGKTRPVSDEPLQCGVDEAGSQAKESDSASSK